MRDFYNSSRGVMLKTIDIQNWEILADALQT